MRLAFFSPMPPSKSGIADYSAALMEPLARHAEVTVFGGAAPRFDDAAFDLALYQIGNNGYHAFAYERALRTPGVVVLHEANLHHLITDITIRRDDWDGYEREAEYAGGPRALAYARRVRALEVGPDYDGLPMTRRILEAARGVIVHSRFMADQVRGAGYSGPLAVIPHGAWLPEGDRMGFRERLGLDEATPLAGIFGFLKPYKRIAQSLRAFRRVVRLEPRTKLILAGEPHPDFPVEQLIRTLGIERNVRLLGFCPIEDFTGYMSACDVVLNLRYPTVGESSGSMLRALGLGKAVLVSAVGAFAEFSDEICVKIPVDSTEEDAIFEYLNLFFSRPHLARELGARARGWVARECNWEHVAERYAEFLMAVREGRAWSEPRADQPEAVPAEPVAPAVETDSRAPEEPVPASSPSPDPTPDRAPVSVEAAIGWAENDAAREYIATHKTRFERTFAIIPPGSEGDEILEMGAYLQMTPVLRSKLGYGKVRGCYYGTLGRSDEREVVSSEGEVFRCTIDHFDAERDRYPYDDGRFSTVLCGELIEHLFSDPMHLVTEVNRILKPGGHFVITTPNVISLRAIGAILQGYHPGFFHAYIKPSADGVTDARHNREYAPREIYRLLEDGGFSVELLETGEFLETPSAEYGWVRHLLDRYLMPDNLRGDGIYAVGRKTGAPRARYPDWLYA